jgi:hypothetical protein
MALKSRRGRFVVDTLRRSALIGLCVLLAEGDRLHLPPDVEQYVILAAVPLLAIAVVYEVRRDLGSYRRLKAVRAGGRWPLGESYAVEIDELCDGARRGGVLVLDEEALEFGPLDSTVVALKDVVAIHVRPTWIEFVTTDRRFRVVPRSYADRERLLFELAVRCNQAMERGIEESASPAPTPPAPPGDVEDLDRRMTGSGLASALAGPMDRGNPAPPRKSGLGNGLFVAGPGDGA